MTTDEELARQARDGKPEAFAVLVDTHQSRTYSLALRLLRNPDDAADATQEAFVRCFDSLDSFDHNRSFGAWIYRITYNHCLDVLRRRKAVGPVLSGSKNEETVISAPDPGPGVEELVVRGEVADEMANALERISDEHRRILVLRYTLDLSYREIAEIMDVPETTITMRLHRAKKALRQELMCSRKETSGSS